MLTKSQENMYFIVFFAGNYYFIAHGILKSMYPQYGAKIG